MTFAPDRQKVYVIQQKTEAGWIPVFFCALDPRYFRAFLSYMKRECEERRSKFEFDDLRVVKSAITVYPKWSFDGRALKEI